MSKATEDFRVSLTPEIDAALTAVARAFGRSKQDVARDVLGEWAKTKLHEARVLVGLLHANGITPVTGGSETEPDGTRRHSGRR